jgi:chaperone BCS1
MDLSTVMTSPTYAKAADAYKQAVATAATVTAYTVLARGVARELVPYELRAAALWAVSAVRHRLVPPPKPPRIKTIYINRYGEGRPRSDDDEHSFFGDARAYLATRIDPAALRRLCLTFDGDRQMLSAVPGDTVTDVFEGVEFKWTLVPPPPRSSGPWEPDLLVLTFDAEQTEVALGRYVPHIVTEMEARRRQETALKIFINENYSWVGINHQHPATFDTVAMDPGLKQTIIADLERFLKRRDYYRRIGKAWKRGYLLYGPPGTGKSSLVAAMANYLCFNLYDLDLSHAGGNRGLQKLLTAMPNKTILLIEDIDCCFSTKSREGRKKLAENDNGESEDCSDDPPPRIPYNYNYEVVRDYYDPHFILTCLILS